MHPHDLLHSYQKYKRICGENKFIIPVSVGMFFHQEYFLNSHSFPNELIQWNNPLITNKFFKKNVNRNIIDYNT